MTRGRLSIHAHFYQPDRRDPFSGRIPADPTAAPAHDWTERITDECYAPNAQRGNLRRIGWNLGPTLATWLRAARPDLHDLIADQDDGTNAIAQAWHHSILPLASMRDRRTEVRWAVRDFALRYGRRPLGIWLPETAVDLATLRICAEEGIRYTILAPWQAGTDGRLDTRRPYRVEVGGGHSIIVMFYDRELSTAVSFEPAATANADDFIRSRAMPRLADPLATGAPPLALVATDGELYGHHQRFRDLFLERITGWYGTRAGDPHVEVIPLGHLLAESSRPAFPIMTILERTSWSCHHGVLRWSGECPDADDGRWKQPLRMAFDRVAGAIDAITEAALLPLGIDPWAARDGYVDVAAGFTSAGTYVDRLLAAAAPSASTAIVDRPVDAGGRPGLAVPRAVTEDVAPEDLVRDVLAAQSSRLSMYASDAWYWDDPVRPETLQALRFAAHAVRTIDAATGSRLEPALVDDLRALRSPSSGMDGATLYALALRQVGQPETA